MGKHRKTLKQKKLTDLRRRSGAFQAKESYFLKTDTLMAPIAPPVQTVYTTNKYLYLIQDVLKTSLITAIIIAIQIVLFLLLKKQILVLPMVKY